MDYKKAIEIALPPGKTSLGDAYSDAPNWLTGPLAPYGKLQRQYPYPIGGLPTKLSAARFEPDGVLIAQGGLRICGPWPHGVESVESSVVLRGCRLRQHGGAPYEDKPGIARQGGIYYNVSVGLMRCAGPRSLRPEAENAYSPPEPAERPNVSHQSSFRGSDHRDVFRGASARWARQCTRARQSSQSQRTERQYKHLQEPGHRAGVWVGQQGFQEAELSLKTRRNSDGTRTHVIRCPRARWTGSPAERAIQCAEDRDAEPAAADCG